MNPNRTFCNCGGGTPGWQTPRWRLLTTHLPDFFNCFVETRLPVFYFLGTVYHSFLYSHTNIHIYSVISPDQLFLILFLWVDQTIQNDRNSPRAVFFQLITNSVPTAAPVPVYIPPLKCVLDGHAYAYNRLPTTAGQAIKRHDSTTHQKVTKEMESKETTVSSSLSTSWWRSFISLTFKGCLSADIIAHRTVKEKSIIIRSVQKWKLFSFRPNNFAVLQILHRTAALCPNEWNVAHFDGRSVAFHSTVFVYGSWYFCVWDM